MKAYVASAVLASVLGAGSLSALDAVVDPAREDAEVAMMPASPMEPELLQALEERAKKVYRCLPAMDQLYIEGGPGFSRETAWRVCYNERHQAPAAVVRLMYGVYGDEERFPIVAFSQDRIVVEGKTYLYTCNAILWKGKKYHVEQWVDITIYGLKD